MTISKQSKCYFIALIFLTSYSSLIISQDNTHFLISPSSGHFQNSEVGDLHWAIGEIAIDTYTDKDANQLTEGFYQRELLKFVRDSNRNSIIDELVIYPNPNNGTFTIELVSLDYTEGISIQVLNVLGQIVLNESLLPLYTGKNTFSFSMPFRLKGMYFLSILVGNRREPLVKKFDEGPLITERLDASKFIKFTVL